MLLFFVILENSPLCLTGLYIIDCRVKCIKAKQNGLLKIVLLLVLRLAAMSQAGNVDMSALQETKQCQKSCKARKSVSDI